MRKTLYHQLVIGFYLLYFVVFSSLSYIIGVNLHSHQSVEFPKNIYVHVSRRDVMAA